jgi:hypothetical protein
VCEYQVADMLGSSAFCGVEDQGAITFRVDVVSASSQIDDPDTNGECVS